MYLCAVIHKCSYGYVEVFMLCVEGFTYSQFCNKAWFSCVISVTLFYHNPFFSVMLSDDDVNKNFLPLMSVHRSPGSHPITTS